MAVLNDNLSGMRNRTRRWLHEVSAGNSFWSDTFINQQLNVGYRKRCVELIMAFEGYFTNIATRNIVADQARYAWPSGFERLAKMEIVRSDGTTVPIMRAERHYAPNYGSSTGSGRDNYLPTYRPLAGGFVLEPPPATSVTDGIRVEYNGLPTQMEADGDSMHPDFPRSLDELVILDSVVACLDSEALLETGATRSVLRMRSEWEMTFERFIDNRMISVDNIIPFSPHYSDA
jgi:hypothetical protein